MKSLSEIENVALRKESVDRNIDTQNFCVCVIVALRKESVDRNPGTAYDRDI